MHSNTLPFKNHSGWLRAFCRPFFSAILLLSLLLPASPAQVLAANTAPALIFPENDVTITAIDDVGESLVAPPLALPVFSWQPVEGAKTYRVQFTTDINFATVDYDIPTPTPLTQFTPSSITKFSDKDWYWHVRVESCTPSCSPGPYSEKRHFVKQWASPGNKPALNAPGDGTTVQFFDGLVFSWEPVVGAAYYQFQVSKSSEFTTLYQSKDTISTTYQPTEPFENGIYYWRVVPFDAGNPSHKGTASDYRAIVMGYNQVPALIEPQNGLRPTFTPVLRWTAVRGALDYRLQVSTDPSFATPSAFVFNNITDNTTYTFSAALENDKNYYWRVQAFNGKSNSDWSSVWYFTKRWYIQPVLLTPVSGYQHVRFPFFSWAPVPGAAKYRIQMSLSPGFATTEFDKMTDNTFYTPDHYTGTAGIRYWKVTPIDGNGKEGVSATGSFNSDETKNSPDLVAPLYYYPPNAFPAPDTQVKMNPYEDRSVAYPLFTWKRVFDVYSGDIVPSAYRVQVGTGMNTNGTVSGVIWQTNTENLSAAPNMGEFSNLIPGTIYYWQVTPLDANGNVIGQFSQVWKTRFDTAKALPATGGPVPQLLRPFYTNNYDPAIHPGYDSAEFVEITPALEWFPVAGATQYQVEISRSAVTNPGGDLTNPVDNASITYPVYAPRDAFGQRSLNHLGFGSYYWHVKAFVNGTWSGWSETWRFQIASQSAWQPLRTPGSSASLKVASDSISGEVASDYDLTGLYAAQDTNDWYFGFDYSGTGNSRYVLYLDQDNRNNSGATADKFGYPVTFNAAHLPEYAIYLPKSGGIFSADMIDIYHWTGSDWDTGVSLDYQGGTVFSSGTFVEIQVPYAPIGMTEYVGTYTLALASVDAAQNKVIDTVPQNTVNVLGAATLDFITSVTEHLPLSSPVNNLAGDPTLFPSAPPFFWDAPAGAPWAGYFGEVKKDAQFTSVEAGKIEIISNAAYYVHSAYGWTSDFMGDNTYYWRIRPRYKAGTGLVSGAWSQPWRFERKGFIPQNLKVSVTKATPTFSWDRVEGAKKYSLLYSTDPTFAGATPVLTTENIYIPTTNLTNATYYWKVSVIRESGGVANDYSSPLQVFTLALPVPTGLSADGKGDGIATPAVVDRAPQLCWDVLQYSNDAGEPVLYAAKYHLLVSKDQNFTSNWEDVTTQQNCYTPLKGYEDTTYYWKVSMIDGNGGAGHNSADSVKAKFVKQYPTVKPQFPVNGSQSGVMPIFSWTADDGVTPYVFGAASYKIQISKYPQIAQGDVDEATTNSTTFTPTKTYPTGQTLYWHVAMIDKDGKIGPYTNALVIFDDKPYDIYLPIARR